MHRWNMIRKHSAIFIYPHSLNLYQPSRVHGQGSIHASPSACTVHITNLIWKYLRRMKTQTEVVTFLGSPNMTDNHTVNNGNL